MTARQTRAKRHSAGLLPYRVEGGSQRVLVFVAHLGGPFWARKDAGAWSIVKGECEPGEALRDVARREFAEEVGVPAPPEPWLELGEIQQRAGKVVTAYAVAAPAALAYVASNTVELEWPRGSGRLVSFPEVDRAEWMSVDEARPRLVGAQAELLDRLLDLVQAPTPEH